MSRTIGASTLNTYVDYYDTNRKTRLSSDLNFRPDVYGRRSDLHFVTGNTLLPGQQGGGVFFTAPFDFDTNSITPATGGQLNGIGYFVRFSADTLPAFITNNPPRYRLFQFLQPTTSLKVMNTNFSTNTWFTSDVNASNNCYPLAANIVAFAVLPKLSEREEKTNLDTLTTDFSYDSRMAWSSGSQPTNMHQLPPVVRVVMVALDESSAKRIQNGATAPDLGYDPATIFDTAATLETSLDTIATKLSEKNLKYRVFRADISIRGAKWSAN
jgi:uncharacterized protein (TIGR02599 family)